MPPLPLLLLHSPDLEVKKAPEPSIQLRVCLAAFLFKLALELLAQERKRCPTVDIGRIGCCSMLQEQAQGACAKASLTCGEADGLVETILQEWQAGRFRLNLERGPDLVQAAQPQRLSQRWCARSQRIRGVALASWHRICMVRRQLRRLWRAQHHGIRAYIPWGSRRKPLPRRSRKASQISVQARFVRGSQRKRLRWRRRRKALLPASSGRQARNTGAISVAEAGLDTSPRRTNPRATRKGSRAG
mmetsp:Transcript_90219/g.234010  ORF Transcript_90219/g.234010 Transcript_90219/m.234010 type:complete len:245 (-) Transcript_90219:151-885(-)